MSKYPDFIKLYKPKGCVVKKVNNKYYVYKATSKRVEGKKYPVQVIEGLIGEITDSGIKTLTVQKVNTQKVEIFEYGFTNLILMFKDEYYSRNSFKACDREIILHSLIVYLSPMSYLSNNKYICSVEILEEKYSISVQHQINSIKKSIGFMFEEIEKLKYICLVKMQNKKFYSDLTIEQEKILEKLGIRIDELRR